jgi:glutamine synthetase
MKQKMITRRDFLRATAGTAMAATLGSGILGEARAEATAKVILIRNAEVLGPQDNVQEEILQSMLDEAIKIMEKSDLMKSILGEHIFSQFLANKKQEIEDYDRNVSREFDKQVSDYEVKKYLPFL